MRAAVSPAERSYPYAGTGYADPHAVTQIGNGLSTSSYAYDNNGNLTQKTTDGSRQHIEWDYANRLVALGSGGATTTYGYDYAGQRVFQIDATTTNVSPFKWYSVASSMKVERITPPRQSTRSTERPARDRRSGLRKRCGCKLNASLVHTPRPSRQHQHRDQRQRHRGPNSHVLSVRGIAHFKRNRHRRQTKIHRPIPRQLGSRLSEC